MALPTVMVVPRWMSTSYDGSNGTELAARFDAEVLSDDGQKLVMQIPGNYYPNEVNAGDKVVMSQDGAGGWRCEAILSPEAYGWLYHELPAGA